MSMDRNKDRSGVKAGLKDAGLAAASGTPPVRVSVGRVAVSGLSAAIPPTV